VKAPHELLADADIFESFCNENEKDRVHLGAEIRAHALLTASPRRPMMWPTVRPVHRLEEIWGD
jgi:hypothetical protein